jgi:DNA invertase Pin-like site-specific DNA recombinase
MSAPLRAGIYCRLSLARDGDTTKVDDQERICRNLCKQRGWEVAAVYADNSRSAWQPNRKRPGWDAMLADVEAGKLTAIVVYHGDRLIRRPEDLGALLALSRVKGVRLASPIGERDLGNPDDEYILWIEAAGFGRESAATSRRVKSSHERRRRKGLPNTGGQGRRLFGFGTDGVIHIPEEAAVVREVTAAVLAGDSITGIVRSLAARSATTTTGKPIDARAVRRMVTNPRYAGLMHDGISSAAWAPIVEREDWEMAAAVLEGRAGLPPGSNARKYLLSGIATCGTCGGTLRVLPAYTARWTAKPLRVQARYRCLNPGCAHRVGRSVALLDGYVSARVVRRLNDPASPPGRLPATPGLAGELRALAAEREQVEAAIADHTKGRLPLLLARLDSLDTRLAEIRELTGASAQAVLLRRHAGLSLDEFAVLQLGTRRALVSGCYKVVVLPASARGPGFRPQDVMLTPR